MKTFLTILVTALFTSCITLNFGGDDDTPPVEPPQEIVLPDIPEDVTDVKLVPPQSAPVSIMAGEKAFWTPSYFVTSEQLLSMFDGNVEAPIKYEQLDVVDFNGYLIHENLIILTIDGIKLKNF